MRDYSKLYLKKNGKWNKDAWKLANENWRLCHEIVELRDGYFCIIPDCCSSKNLDLDHAISRVSKSTFFEADILGFLCKHHHTIKSMNDCCWVGKMVDRFHQERVGKDLWDLLVKQSRTKVPFKEVWYQEQENIRLKEERSVLLIDRHND